MTDVCTICAEPVDQLRSALCHGCDQPFHLRVRQDDAGPECGRVWVNEQFMTLQYACLRCLGEQAAPKRRRYRKVR